MKIIQRLKAIGFPPWPFSTVNGVSRVYGRSSSAGVDVTGLSALQVSAIYAIARVLSQTMGSLELNLWKRTADGKILTTDHPLYTILHDSPNAYMTSMEWREAMELAITLFGNGFSEIVRLGKRVVALNLLPPDRVQVKLDQDGTLFYEFCTKNGPKRYEADQIFHVHNFSLDCIVGLNPIEYQRTTIGVALARQQYAASIFATGGRPGGVLEHPGNPDEKIRKALKDSWEQVHGGPSNGGKVAVLWNGMKYNPIGMSLEDVNYIEGSKFSVTELARAYGVQPHKIGDLERATFSNIEEQNIEFIQDTVLPRATRWEQRIKKSLLAGTGSSDVFAEFDLAGMKRGNMAALSTYISTLANTGIMTRNEGRRQIGLNLSKQAGADDLTVQSAMVDLSQLSKLTSGKPGKPAPAGAGDTQQ